MRTGGFYGRFAGKNAELKFFDTIRGQGNIQPGGTIFSPSLNLIPQGTTESERIGRKCTLKTISIKGQTIKAATTTVNGTADRVRWIIYLDTQTNGGAATVLNILETADIESFRNLAESSRFKILYDRTIATNCHAGSGDAGEDFGRYVYNFNFNKRCNIPLEFSSTTGVITELRSNNIGILIISEDTDLASVKYTCRVRFSDN